MRNSFSLSVRFYPFAKNLARARDYARRATLPVHSRCFFVTSFRNDSYGVLAHSRSARHFRKSFQPPVLVTLRESSAESREHTTLTVSGAVVPVDAISPGEKPGDYQTRAPSVNPIFPHVKESIVTGIFANVPLAQRRIFRTSASRLTFRRSHFDGVQDCDFANPKPVPGWTPEIIADGKADSSRGTRRADISQSQSISRTLILRFATLGSARASRQVTARLSRGAVSLKPAAEISIARTHLNHPHVRGCNPCGEYRGEHRRSR